MKRFKPIDIYYYIYTYIDKLSKYRSLKLKILYAKAC